MCEGGINLDVESRLSGPILGTSRIINNANDLWFDVNMIFIEDFMQLSAASGLQLGKIVGRGISC